MTRWKSLRSKRRRPLRYLIVGALAAVAVVATAWRSGAVGDGVNAETQQLEGAAASEGDVRQLGQHHDFPMRHSATHKVPAGAGSSGTALQADVLIEGHGAGAGAGAGELSSVENLSQEPRVPASDTASSSASGTASSQSSTRTPPPTVSASKTASRSVTPSGTVHGTPTPTLLCAPLSPPGRDNYAPRSAFEPPAYDVPSAGAAAPAPHCVRTEQEVEDRVAFHHDCLNTGRRDPGAPVEHLALRGTAPETIIRSRAGLRLHAFIVHAALAPFRGYTPMVWANYSGPWIENRWIAEYGSTPVRRWWSIDEWTWTAEQQRMSKHPSE
jgi:hypothetical protein